MKLILILVVLLSGCSLFPVPTDAVIDTVKGRGCEIKKVTASDSFNWKFLAIGTTRNTTVECHKPSNEE